MLLRLPIIFAFCCGTLCGAVIHLSDPFPFPQLREIKKRIVFPPDYKTDSYLLRQAMFEAFPTGEIVMLGDSITAAAEWNDILRHFSISNRGIGGDTTDGVLGRLDSVFSRRTKKIFLMIGINDVLRQEGHKVLSNYESIIRKITKKDTMLFAQSILLTMRPDYNKPVSKLNEGIQQLCNAAPRCKFIELNRHLASSGKLDYGIDVVHLSPEGYRIWSDQIKPDIEESWTPPKPVP